MEKYAVVFSDDGVTSIAVFTGKQNALDHAAERALSGVKDVELFQRLGAVRLRPEVVEGSESNGDNVKKPQRKAAKPGPKAKKAKKTKTAPKKAKSKKAGWPKTCIATDCRKKHKGPRFRFLCPDHIGASKKQIEKWKADRE